MIAKQIGIKVEREMKDSSSKRVRLSIIGKPKIRRIFIVVTVLFAINAMAYSELQMNSIYIHGNQFLNFFFIALIDIPSVLICWYLMDKVGRRWVNCLIMLCCAFSLYLPFLFRIQHSTAVLSILLIGKFMVSANHMVIYQQAIELYPTQLRNSGLGFGSTAGSIANIFVPYIVNLTNLGVWVPLFTMGAFCTLAATLAPFLPETLNENLPQTIEEAEKFGEETRFWSWKK
ncbi:solute carrier family 22 member 5-like protein [Dinothrombium tinctorium]|uniref:Solute carrier family 22 member 5-like protein n=1 Tax=Dinothrombium tinctorium TaxID=1965070 RepID=A0A3S3NX23_9ACAR|nr:solute carrier family 22 member 5-like protein [Dinothrombium tinctorium]